MLIVKDVIEYLSKEIDIPPKNIKLYKDRKGLYSIINDKNIVEVTKNKSSNEINIYYQIIPDLDVIIKRELIKDDSFGKFYKCIEVESNKVFILKKYNVSQNYTLSEMLNTEINILSTIENHPRIVKFERKIEKKNKLYILLEYMPGGSLGKYIQVNGSLPEDKISKYSKQILEALDYLHEKKIIHRYLKGNSVLFDGSDNVKLSDFGLAKFLNNISSQDLLNGAVQSNIGTPNWTAPEVINGEKYGILVDIWSFGAVLIEMLTGKRPYHDLSMFKVLSKLAIEKKMEYKPPNNTSSEMIDFISLCVKPNPCHRQTAKELLQHNFIMRYLIISD